MLLVAANTQTVLKLFLISAKTNETQKESVYLKMQLTDSSPLYKPHRFVSFPEVRFLQTLEMHLPMNQSVLIRNQCAW